jgi:hypothetical protein
MPVSDLHHISDVLHVVEQARPSRVLDVGVGFGKWGMLCREVLDVTYGRLQREEWQATIDGVEVFESYRNPLWAGYDRVEIGDVRELLPRLGRYDLVVICDVIEHFDKEEGLALLRRLLEHAELVILTSPRGFIPQGSEFGNEHERHRSGWDEGDLREFPHLYQNIGLTFMAVIARDPARLRSLRLRHPLEGVGVKRGFVELLRLGAERTRHRLLRAR